MAYGLLAAAIWIVVAGRRASGTTTRIERTRLDAAWPALLTVGAGPLHIVTNGALPSDTARDVLAALAHAGRTVNWSGPMPAAIGLTAERVREPGAPTLIRVQGRGPVVLRDGASALDSLPDGHAGATFIADPAGGVVEGIGGWGRTGVQRPLDAPLRAVLVLGRPSWETKFVVTALEEAGWRVEMRTPLAPWAAVASASPSPLDTAHFAAVVALDSSAVERTGAIVAFVRSGGGLVALPDAARLVGINAVLPATPGGRRASEKRSFDATQPLRSLPWEPLLGLRADAVVLSARDRDVVIAARREREGRAAAVGYLETWHWRLEGGPDALDAHRRWWSRLVATVAATPRAEDAAGAGSLPVAAWVDALGAPSPAPPRREIPSELPPWSFVVLCAILLAEWGSRRLRGAR